MPSLRIYFFAKVRDSVEIIRSKILENKEILARLEKGQILQGGFYNKILSPAGDNYFVSDYFIIGSKNIPTLSSELAYFHYGESSRVSETREYPILIKIIFNPVKNIVCFYSRAKISNEMSDKLIYKLNLKGFFNFTFNPMIYTYREEKLNILVDSFNVKDFTLLSAYNYDNIITIKNPRKISETDLYLELVREQSEGNWTHLNVPFEDLNFTLKVSKTTKRFITIATDYINDSHLVRTVDFLVNSIAKIEDFSGARQSLINSYF